MGMRILLLCVVLLPSLASAEIYKWKDTNGVIRYSDVPPPSNVKQEAIHGKKIPKPTSLAPQTPVNADANTELDQNKAETPNTTKIDSKLADAKLKEEAAQRRARDAEQLKQQEEQKKVELDAKQANCKVAKQRLATYKNGGRISKVDENGNRHFLGDAEITLGKDDAQKDVEKFCD